MQINPQLKRRNFETRRFKACINIYIYIHTFKISSYHSHVTELLMILNRNQKRVYIKSNKFAIFDDRREREDSFDISRHGCSRVLMMLEEAVGKLSN